MIHVDDAGTDTGGCGGESSPCRTITEAVRSAKAGDTIKVHAGDYHVSTPIVLNKSGAPGRPIVLTGAGDGAATIRLTYPEKACGATRGPTFTRAIHTGPGMDHWVIRDLQIIGGILIQARGILSDAKDVAGVHDAHKLDLPGQETFDPEAADRLYRELGIDSADSIQIVGNDISGIGILTHGMNQGLIEGNTIHDINCWSGGGMWIGKFTHKTVIRNNHIHDIAANKGQHYLVEGIRLGSGAGYNTVERNLVERIGDAGRGITADVHSNWNVYRFNMVREAAIGFSEQEGNRGNKWVNNRSENNRRWNYQFGFGKNRAADHSADYGGVVECNASSGAGVADVAIQAVNGYVFRKNQFAVIEHKDHWKSEWNQVRNNTWEGSSLAPERGRAASSRADLGDCAPFPEDVGPGRARTVQ